MRFLHQLKQVVSTHVIMTEQTAEATVVEEARMPASGWSVLGKTVVSSKRGKGKGWSIGLKVNKPVGPWSPLPLMRYPGESVVEEDAKEFGAFPKEVTDRPPLPLIQSPGESLVEEDARGFGPLPEEVGDIPKGSFVVDQLPSIGSWARQGLGESFRTGAFGGAKGMR